MRYFTKLQSDGSAYSLYRFEVQEKKILEEYWTPKGWQHDQDARIVGYLSISEPDLDEITEEFARKLFPHIFGLASTKQEDSLDKTTVDKKIYTKKPEGRGEKTRRPIRYLVHLEGSSIYGTLNDIDDFKRAQNFLLEKLGKGKLACFKWWCKECKENPLANSSTPDRHVIKISIPNVLKIIGESKVDWKWKDSNSDWAKSHGAAKDSFSDIVKRKSRPNWVIRISAEEAGIDYVFKSKNI